MEKVIIIFSGGQDSTTCLLMAINKYGRENVEAISFIYNEKYRKDTECAKNICKILKVKHTIFDAGIIQNVANSNNVEGRNLILISLVALYGQVNNIYNIIIGTAGEACHSDCSRKFADSIEETLYTAMDQKFNIITPLMNLKKSEIWKIADNLGYLEFIETETYSCWESQDKHCMNCLSCEMRFDSLKEYKKEKEKSGK